MQPLNFWLTIAIFKLRCNRTSNSYHLTFRLCSNRYSIIQWNPAYRGSRMEISYSSIKITPCIGRHSRIGAPRIEFVSLLNIYLCLKTSYIYISTMAAKRHPLPMTRTEVIELSKAGKYERQIAYKISSRKVVLR